MSLTFKPQDAKTAATKRIMRYVTRNVHICSLFCFVGTWEIWIEIQYLVLVLPVQTNPIHSFYIVMYVLIIFVFHTKAILSSIDINQRWTVQRFYRSFNSSYSWQLPVDWSSRKCRTGLRIQFSLSCAYTWRPQVCLLLFLSINFYCWFIYIQKRSRFV